MPAFARRALPPRRALAGRAPTLALVLRDFSILVLVFFAVTVVAYLAGAENTATAATFGTIAFAATLVGLMARGTGRA